MSDTMPFSSCAMAVGLLAPFARFRDPTGSPVALDRISFEIGLDFEHGTETYTWTDLFLVGAPTCAVPSTDPAPEGFRDAVETVAQIPGMAGLELETLLASPDGLLAVSADNLLLECLETWTRTTLARAILARHGRLSASVVVKFFLPANGALSASTLVVVDDDLTATDDVIATVQAALQGSAPSDCDTTQA